MSHLFHFDVLPLFFGSAVGRTWKSDKHLPKYCLCGNVTIFASENWSFVQSKSGKDTKERDNEIHMQWLQGVFRLIYFLHTLIVL